MTASTTQQQALSNMFAAHVAATAAQGVHDPTCLVACQCQVNAVLQQQRFKSSEQRGPGSVRSVLVRIRRQKRSMARKPSPRMHQKHKHSRCKCLIHRASQGLHSYNQTEFIHLA
eukprot:m.1346518 g.1346518  ORF g.1346518 m.1346518 type:complete len:115 (-) comp24904_c0_seq81:72-416(-)